MEDDEEEPKLRRMELGIPRTSKLVDWGMIYLSNEAVGRSYSPRSPIFPSIIGELFQPLGTLSR